MVAPAGSGKSVLLGQWMRASVSPACHVQVSPAHDDPVVLARALTSAIASVAPDFDPRVADSVAASGSDLGTVFVSRLLVGLEELDGELVIVLDDVHRLANTAVWADLDQLIERLPGNVRLVSQRPMGSASAAPSAPAAVSRGRDPSQRLGVQHR